jgi:hypothetical protein
MESPVYCLDEFDAFLDAENRNAVIEAILKQKTVTGQRILISPLAIGPGFQNGLGGNNVKVQRLQDPARPGASA